MTGADVVVVGSGSAGSALAATLVAAGVRVTLIEAGPSTLGGGGVVRPDATDCDQSGRLDWGYTAEALRGRRLAVPRGRVLGGTSAINTCVAVRPDPESFERWSELVGGGWAWGDVLGDFRSIERDVDFGADAHHGDAGALPIVRWRDDELDGPSAAFLDACVGNGHRRVADLNEPGVTGIGTIPMNRAGSERASGDAAFLAPLAATSADHLEIVTDRLVDRLLLDGRTVRGVVTVGPGGAEHHHGDHTVLCAGSYGTPAILQRSGLGPARVLHDLGIEPVEDLPVGAGLHDHPMVQFVVARPAAPVDSPGMQVILKTTTAGSEIVNDVQLTVFNRPDLPFFGLGHLAPPGRAAMLCVSLQHSLQRGFVRITSADPTAAPAIRLDHLGHPSDLRRTRLATRDLMQIAAAGPMVAFRSLESLDIAGATDAELDELLVARVSSTHHPMGTVAMAAADREGVVDADLRVRGVDGLSVADASVIPSSLNANIHLACTMIGRRHGRELAAR